MAGSLNQVQLIGHVGRDPELRNMQNGDQVANLSLATTEAWKNKEGEKQERTEWHRIVVWGALAGVVDKYVTKGTKLFVQGSLQTRSWEKDGDTKFSTEVVLRGFGAQLILLSSKEGNGGAAAASGGERSETRPSTSSGTSRTPRTAPNDGFEDDNIPF